MDVDRLTLYDSGLWGSPRVDSPSDSVSEDGE